MKDIVNKEDQIKYDELSKASKDLHQANVILEDKRQSALVFVTLGSISLITGLIFLILSYNKKLGLEVLSLQFFISIILSVIGVACLIYGIIKLVKASKAKKINKIKINEIAKQKDILLNK